MVAVVMPGMNAGMWLPPAPFAASGKQLQRRTQPIFQTTSLVLPEGFSTHGR